MRGYKALLIDDEEDIRELLESMIKKYCPQISQIEEADSSAMAISIMSDFQPDVVFLDIEMPGGNGFDFLKQLKEIPFKIIFVTAYDSYALQAIKYSALDYLLKPVNKDELINAVEKLDEVFRQEDKINLLNHNLTETNKKVILSTQDEMLFVEVNEIIRLEAEVNYTKVYLLDDKPILLSGSLSKYAKLLEGQNFFRSHKSHLVNPNHIKKYIRSDGGFLLMKDGAEIPIARMKKEEFKRLFL